MSFAAHIEATRDHSRAGAAIQDLRQLWQCLLTHLAALVHKPGLELSVLAGSSAVTCSLETSRVQMGQVQLSTKFARPFIAACSPDMFFGHGMQYQGQQAHSGAGAAVPDRYQLRQFLLAHLAALLHEPRLKIFALADFPVMACSIEASRTIAEQAQLFKITVSFGSVPRSSRCPAT